MKVAFVATTLAAGGAERVISHLANYWVAHSWEVSIITLSDTDADFYELHHDVVRTGLGLVGESGKIFTAAASNLRRVRKLRTTLKELEPDVVISFCDRTNILTLLASINLKYRVIVSERTDPAHHKIGRLWNTLRTLTYPQADALVVQSETVLRWFDQHIECKNVVVIPNPVLPPRDTPALPEITLNKPALVTVGRFTIEKGYDILLRSFARIQQAFPSWSLTLIGDGPLRHNLEELRDELGLAGRVFFPGQIRLPYPVLLQADIFVLPSRFEGFPNALCEAMACGLAVVAFDCPSGPREIIRDGIDGVLIPNGNIDALADAMRRLMSDQDERERLSRRSPEVLGRFGLGEVVAKWEQVIQHAVIGG